MSQENLQKVKLYKPERQLPGCCVPTCLRMIFQRHNIAPDLSQEDIGNALGLVVPPGYEKRFQNVAVSAAEPASGYGTRINLPEFSLEAAFERWALPLDLQFRFIDQIKDARALKTEINAVLEDDRSDAIMCMQSGALQGNPHPDRGHVVLLSGGDDRHAYLLDPNVPHENGKASYRRLFKAMRLRGRENYGGLWITKNTLSI